MGKLPEIIKHTMSEGQVFLELNISADLPYFEGHFPNTPILPGVVMLNWAEVFGREFLNIKTEFAAIETLKFQQVVQPKVIIELALRYDELKAKLYFAYYNGDVRHSSGRIQFKS